MENWAEMRAREFCNERWPSQRVEADELAALLREVEGRTRSETLVHCCVHADEKAPYLDGCECVICHRQRTLAEVRRVVEDVYERDEDMPPHKRDEILSRLESL